MQVAEQIRWHECAELFPLMEGEAFDRLVEDIRLNGILEPVVMIDGAILDGRNRYMATRQLAIECPVTEYDGDDPLAFVVSKNLARRHMTESQRAMVASKLATLPAHRPGKGADLHPSAERAAEMFNVSERSVKTARAVRDASPDLARKVETGAISVSLAEKVTDLPAWDISDIIAAPPAETKQLAREKVKAHVAQNSGENEWYTPDDFLDRARAVLGGFDLDPASSSVGNKRVRAERFFTAVDDGISREWAAATIWMNPPYAQPLIGQFCERFAQEIVKGAEGVALVNNATETVWFQRLASVSSAICFPKGRVRFLDPEGNPGAPLQGQAVVYAGTDPAGFAAEFDELGFVVRL